MPLLNWPNQFLCKFGPISFVSQNLLILLSLRIWLQIQGHIANLRDQMSHHDLHLHEYQALLDLFAWSYDGRASALTNQFPTSN